MNQHAVEPLTEAVISTLRRAAHLLTGHQRRQFQAQVAIDYFDGSPRRAERVFGWGRGTVELGLHELRTGINCQDAFSARGAKRVEVKQPAIVARLEQLLANDIAGDPMSEEKWVRSSLTHLSGKLKQIGYNVSRGTDRSLLRGMGYT